MPAGKSESRQRTDKRKAPRTAFPKGVSGNPGGRPKRTEEEMDLIAACKARSPAALATIVEIMENGEVERNRLAAAQAIIERGYGKPMQPIEQSGKDGGPIQIAAIDMSNLSDDQVRALASIRINGE